MQLHVDNVQHYSRDAHGQPKASGAADWMAIHPSQLQANGSNTAG